MGAGDNGKAREKKPFPFSLFPSSPARFLCFDHPAGATAEERAFLGVRHKLLLNRAVENVDQSQHTPRSGKFTFLEKIRARLER